MKIESGQPAAKVLDEYMQGFRQRNSTFRVFAAYLHMDEATSHLHIEFCTVYGRKQAGT